MGRKEATIAVMGDDGAPASERLDTHVGVALMEVVLRAAAIYLFLWVATKAMGKRELAQLSPFELILLVTMGDLIQQGVTGDDRSVTGAVLAVSTMSILIVISSVLDVPAAAVFATHSRGFRSS